MPIIERSFEQNSDSWYKARLGNPGASSMDKIITLKGVSSKSRLDYMFTLAAEIVRGESDESYSSKAMENGSIREKEARGLFEFLHDVKIEQVGMVYKNNRKLFHASADGIINDDSGIEIKCPLAKTHTKYLLGGVLPTQYYVQVQSSLYISEREYWWFMSYVPLMKPLIVRVDRDEDFIKLLSIELKSFCKELKQVVKQIR